MASKSPVSATTVVDCFKESSKFMVPPLSGRGSQQVTIPTDYIAALLGALSQFVDGRPDHRGTMPELSFLHFIERQGERLKYPRAADQPRQRHRHVAYPQHVGRRRADR